MGNIDSVEGETLSELNAMKLILDKGFYKVYESKDNQKYDFYFIKSNIQTFEEELNIAQKIQKQEEEQKVGITKIQKIEIKSYEKLFTRYNCLNILTEHPSYNLKEYLQKKAKNNELKSQQITDLFVSVVNAQYMLGSKKQFLGFENIYTNDGHIWKIKPFVETKSFYLEFQELKSNNQNLNKLSGFPSPEEFNQSQCDIDRVQIFSLGIIILQLITKQNSSDIYEKYRINEDKLQQRIHLLKKYNGEYEEKTIESLIEMLDLDLVRRPNYHQLYTKLNSKESKIKSQMINENIQPIGDIFQSSERNINKENILIIDAISKIDKSIDSKLQDLRSSINKSNLHNTATENVNYYGARLNGKYHGIGKLFNKQNQPIYEGDFYEGQYHNFGTLNYYDTINLTEDFDYNDCTNIDKYAKCYEGSFNNGKKHGEGRLILTNGETFVGTFFNNIINGYGAFTRKSSEKILGIWTYGKFMNNPQNFESFRVIPSGNNPQYEGLSKLDTQRSQQLQSQGFGNTQTKFDLSNINEENIQRIYYDEQQKYIQYEGGMQQGKKNGKGKSYFNCGKIQYNGDFLNDYFHGQGILYNENPVVEHKIDNLLLRDVQNNGYWKHYEGQFQNGKKHGQGIWYLTDNSEYLGKFEDDLPHGEGIVRKTNAEQFKGEWDEGVLKRKLQ